MYVAASTHPVLTAAGTAAGAVAGLALATVGRRRAASRGVGRVGWAAWGGRTFSAAGDARHHPGASARRLR